MRHCPLLGAPDAKKVRERRLRVGRGSVVAARVAELLERAVSESGSTTDCEACGSMPRRGARPLCRPTGRRPCSGARARRRTPRRRLAAACVRWIGEAPFRVLDAIGREGARDDGGQRHQRRIPERGLAIEMPRSTATFHGPRPRAARWRRTGAVPRALRACPSANAFPGAGGQRPSSPEAATSVLHRAPIEHDGRGGPRFQRRAGEHPVAAHEHRVVGEVGEERGTHVLAHRVRGESGFRRGERARVGVGNGGFVHRSARRTGKRHGGEGEGSGHGADSRSARGPASVTERTARGPRSGRGSRASHRRTSRRW